MQCLFLLLLISPVIANYRDFLADCIDKRNNGFCDMECRNFTADLNDFELNDCSSAETVSYNVSITVEIYPLEALRQLQKYELLLRQTLHTQVEVDVSAEANLEEIEDEYRKNSSDRILWPLDLNYTVFLMVCEDCPEGEDVINTGTKKLPSVLAIRVVRNYNSSASGFSHFFAVAGVIGVIGVVTVGTLYQINSRKRRLVNQTSVWVPEVENTKRSKLSPALPEQLDAWWGHSTPPPPPTMVPPPVSKGHVVIKVNEVDLAANYEEVVILKNTALHSYVEGIKNDEFHLDELNRLLITCPINGQDDHGATAFLLAVRGGNIFLAKHLLYSGADGNRMDKAHMTALHHAVETGDLKMLKMLTRWQVPLNNTTQPLEMINVLVDTVIDDRKAIDALSKNGFTPLMRCASVPSYIALKLAKVLIECGADVADMGDMDCSNPKHRTVLHYAAEYRQPELIKYILTTQAGLSVIDQMDSQEKTALCIACQNGDISSARILMEHGASQFMPVSDKEKQPRALAGRLLDNGQGIVDMLDEFKEKHIKGGTVRRNKRNHVKRPQRRSSGYHSGGGETSPPPAPRSSPPRTPHAYQDLTTQCNRQHWQQHSSMNTPSFQGAMSSQMNQQYQQAASFENYLYE